MLRTGAQYLDDIQDERELYMDGERISDITTHPALAPIIAERTGIYDMVHEPCHADTLSYAEGDVRSSVCNQPPTTEQDWHDKRRGVDTVLNDLGGVFITSFQELAVAIFVSGGLRTIVAKQLWDDTSHQVNPTVAAASIVVIKVLISLFLVAQRMRPTSAATAGH